jgi:BirA family biotin operon repressor/biotin-[acetyl-CoA-carboxylase] ligase
MSFDPKKIIVLETIDSTNNYAMAMVQKGAANAGYAVFAMDQTQGKGRRGRQWQSNKGENIMLSIPVEMQWLPISRQFELSVAVALAAHSLVAKEVSIPTAIKWPNDIFIGDRKAGGILIENVIKGSLWQWSVIGIGINVNQTSFGESGPTATSLKQTTGKTYNVLDLAEALRVLVLDKIESIKSGQFEKMLADYNEKLFGRDLEVRLKRQNIIFQTKITGVSSSGQLITKDAFERQFNFDEVEFKGLV